MLFRSARAVHTSAPMSFADDPARERPSLGPGKRLLGLALGWGIYVACGPGAVWGAGSPLAFLGVAVWALVARRPGRRAFLCEWFVGALALGVQMSWIAYVFPVALVYVWPGFGVYAACMGVLLRRLSRRFRPAIAVPATWVGVETLRMLLPPPAGLSWLFLGHHAAATPWIAGSARVWGGIGLGFVLAAAAGFVVELVEWRSKLRPAPRAAGFALGIGPALVAIVLGLVVRAPECVDGPRLLLVQPAFEQRRKQSAGTQEELFTEQIRLTAEALRAEAEAHRPAPDLVCWGETMLPATLAGEGLAEAAKQGLGIDPWYELEPAELPARVADRLRHERDWVKGVLFGKSGAHRSGILPEGTGFLAGAEVLVAHEGRLRRTNAVVLWNAEGERAGVAGKVHVVPGGETMLGLERFEAVRRYIYEVSNYVPDFLGAERTGVLDFTARDGRRYAIGATVCFDNAYLEAYAEPLRRGPLDFHLVVSNEGWYLESWEMDQMLAFSRLEALSTGRAFVRATNAGVTALFGPDGRELARLVVDGTDRLVPGTLAVDVPVPAAGAAAARTPFVFLQPLWRGAALLLPLLLALVAGKRPVTGGERRVIEHPDRRQAARA